MKAELTFGEWLRRRRGGLGLTQKALAQQVGYAEVTLRKVEADELRPSHQMAEKLAQALQLTSEEWPQFVRFARDEPGWDEVTLPTHAPPAASPSTNLPASVTPLIGRTVEIYQLQQLLGQKEVRLVTLTGIGGAGKTRLSLAVAAQLPERFADGIFFVKLAAINDPALVADTIAQTLGVRENPGQPVAEHLKVLLGAKQLLLVVDNCEHVITATPLLTELLLVAPRLKILATSREPLHLSGEYEFPVPPLPVPARKALPAVEALAQIPAVALFIQRAQAVKPDFTFTQENARLVAELCVQLDGLPLAIELAAARIKLFSPQEMLTYLDRRFQWLTSGARDAPVHQRTLQSTLDWSYNLLEAGEQLLFRRLGIFIGGWTLASAEAVCKGASDLLPDVLAGMASLIDKNLLQRQLGANGETRFGMLETLRIYALEQLSANQEMTAVQQQHADYFLGLVKESKSHFTSATEGVWLDRLEEELGNLRAVLAWSKAEASRVQVGLRLADDLYLLWNRRGHMNEGRRWLTELLTLPAAASPTPARAAALRAAGLLATRQSDYATAHTWLEESVSIAKELGNNHELAYSLMSLADVENFQAHYDRAIALFEEGLALTRAAGDQYGTAFGLYALGGIALAQHNFAQARAVYEECLVLHRGRGNKNGIVLALNGLGKVAHHQHHYDQAKALYEESLALARQLRIRPTISWLLIDLGGLELVQGNAGRAKGLYAESLAIAVELGLKHSIAECLAGLAEVMGLMRQPERAVRLFGATQRLLDEIGAQLSSLERLAYDQHLTDVQAHLSAVAFAAAWSQGQAMTLEQAIDYARATAQS